MKKTKLTRSALGLKKVVPNPMLSESISMEAEQENKDLLEQARIYYDALYDWRKRSIRSRKYYRGDQWSDVVFDFDENKAMLESEYISKQGRPPLKQNIIRQLVRNQIGQYRKGITKTIVIARKEDDRAQADMVSGALEYASDINMLGELDAREYEKFLLTGGALQKNTFDYIPDRDLPDVIVDSVSAHRIIFNSDVADIRGKDFRFIGQMIDTPLDTIVHTFANSPEEEKKIREIYADSNKTIQIRDGLTAKETDRVSFLTTSDTGKQRLFEFWYQKNVWKMLVHDEASGRQYTTKRTAAELAKENVERILQAGLEGITADEVPLLVFNAKVEPVWHYKFLTPNGYCLKQGETPYDHGEHPYTLLLYPLVDGEVWGFVEDIIDQQRSLNRTMILLDMMNGAGAKGVLLVHEDHLGGKSPEEFSNEWVKFNGVIVLKGSTSTPMPTQVTANANTAGAREMVALHLSLLKDISGIQDAMQGKAPSSGTAASLYAQEAENSTISSYDYLQSFHTFKERRDRKMMKLILQYYDKPRNMAISGMTGSSYKMYDPEKVRNADYDLKTAQSQNTPTYKALMEEKLSELLKAQFIDLETYLSHSTMPFATVLLEDVKRMKQQGAQVSPEMVDQAGANPETMNMLNQAIGRKAA